ncbi:WD repeat-containing protein 70 [Bonamia ostreae]|uniref:WD repeat-containing protein 70 n=1 Tax=Bonamia ostreae TaxID=126728 RepID=A0ABV2AE47_9EUKA
MTETREFKLNQYTEIEQIHNKLVTAATVDPSGSRLATSSLDYSVKLWSFSGFGLTSRDAEKSKILSKSRSRRRDRNPVSSMEFFGQSVARLPGYKHRICL